MDVSRGAPFEVDVEKNLELESVGDEKEPHVSDENEAQSLSTNHSPVPANELSTNDYGPRKYGRLLKGDYRSDASLS